MDKKIFTSDSGARKTKERKRAMTWTPPMVHRGKENYVDFYALDPDTGKMKRKKVMLDRLKGKTRATYARQVVEELTQKLMRGWNPWVEQKAGEQFVPWGEVVEHYRNYVVKLHNDSAFREETMRDYLSRLKVLSEWEGMKKFNIFFAYQIDGMVLAQFLDYILIDRGCSPQTYNNYVAWLRTFFGWMKTRRFIHDDPTDGLQQIKRKREKNRTVIPENVLRQIKDFCMKENQHFLLACYLLYYMFVRPREMSLLRIRDFHLKSRTLMLYGSQTKNRNDAVVTLPDHIIHLMVELKVFDRPGGDFLFSDDCKPGEKWRDSKQFRDYWNHHVRKALKLPPHYKFYSLKDTGITNMLRALADPISVRDQARHSSLLITNTYTPLDIKEANAEILKAAKIMHGEE